MTLVPYGSPLESVLDALIGISVVVVALSFMATIFWLMFIYPRQRNRKLRNESIGDDVAAYARERGWDFERENVGYLESYEVSPFHRAGRKTSVFDLVSGTHRGRSFTSFQFVKKQGLAGEQQPVIVPHLRVFIVPLVSSTPRMMVTDAGWTPRWHRTVTTDDVAFDKAFKINVWDKEFARRLLNEPLRRWLLDNPPLGAVTGGSLQFSGYELIAWYEEKDRFDPRVLEPVLDYLCALLDRLPADAVR